MLDVVAIFSTIQGEGPFSGVPAVFIRLAGCNLQCPFCDTDYTSGRRELNNALLVDAVRSEHPLGVGLVVITGGEPFRQDIGKLIACLVDQGYAVQVETNGTLPPSDLTRYGLEWLVQPRSPLTGAYIVCSPKTGKVHEDVVARACAFKYVIDAWHVDPDDGLPTSVLGHTVKDKVARPPAWWDRPVYIQPADEQDAQCNTLNTDVAIASAMDHGYTLQLQIQKYLGME
ncbi:MAG: 7-carboxy-7-deazaguanine synthase QueE [Spiribacter salinus]|uniref:7-carboxy-7-deazaguanine synthase n=1 Tax=Spiribacter salinus TaxID=1335746 RepID=A0A540VN03_9GAMM|nr:MAG: 7-carboxy-7-deazaguanine synthase QueE [Spiribacter salinus]